MPSFFSIPSAVLDLPNQVMRLGKSISDLTSLFNPLVGLPKLAATVGGIIRSRAEAIASTTTRMRAFVSLAIVNNLRIAGSLRTAEHVETLKQYFLDDADKVIHSIKGEIAQAGSFTPLATHVNLLRSLQDVGAGYLDRFEMAANSILKLIEKVNPEMELIENLIPRMRKLLFSKPTSAKDALKDELETLGELIGFMIVQMNPALRVAVKLMSKGSKDGILQSVFPMWIQPGMLNGWLGASQDFEVFYPDSDEKKGIELEFRRELVAALDRYFRSASDSHGKLLRATDQRSSVEGLLDVVGVICSTVFGFVLRSSPNIPSACLPKLDFANPFAASVRADDFGDEVAATIARQIAQPLKAVLGVALNGVWIFTPNNQPLVEAVSGFLAHAVRSLIEFLLRDLFWSVEIHETYENDTSQNDKLVKIDPWDTGERCPDGPKLVYRVYRHYGLLGNLEADTIGTLLTGSPLLLDLLKDFVAYRAAIREYEGTLALGVPSDDVSAKATFDGKTLVVTAKSDWTNLTIPSKPVLRAYYEGKPIVLTPESGDAHTETYTGRFPNSVGGGQLWVGSNYGGSCTRLVSLVSASK